MKIRKYNPKYRNALLDNGFKPTVRGYIKQIYLYTPCKAFICIGDEEVGDQDVYGYLIAESGFEWYSYEEFLELLEKEDIEAKEESENIVQNILDMGIIEIEIYIGQDENGDSIYSGDKVEWIEAITFDNKFVYCTARVRKLKDNSVVFEDAIMHKADGVKVHFNMDEKYESDGYTPIELLKYCTLSTTNHEPEV